MMPIQRQSEGYDGLNGSNLRWAKEYETHDLPEGLVNALGRGVGITSGLNNPRAMEREAAAGFHDNIPMGPSVDTYGGHPYDEAEEARDHAQRAEFDDPTSGYGFAGGNDEMFREDPTAIPTGDVQGFGFGGNGPYDEAEWDYDTQGPPPGHFGNVQVDYNNQFSSHTASFGEAHLGGPASAKIAVAPAVQNAVVPGWVGHGYVPGHRIALPLPQGTFQGTVTHLAGPEVGVRWDDGQHSTEEPANLRPL